VRNLDNYVLKISKAVKIYEAWNQYCSKLRIKELEGQVPIHKYFHF